MAGIAILAIAAESCQHKTTADSKATATVKIAEAKAIEGGETLQFPGRVQASSETSISFKVSGTIKQIAVREGQQVTAGQLLAELDDSDYRVQLSATEAEQAQIKADAERVVSLYEKGATTASNYDKARYGLEQINAKLQNHRNQVGYCRVTAPTAGAVQNILFEKGETVGAGMPILTLIGSGQAEIEITVPARVRQQIDKISSATATFNATGTQTYDLRLLNALPKANATGMYQVRLAIESTEQQQPSIGMNGWVRLQYDDTQTDEVSVPATAIIYSADGDHLYIAENGKAVKRSITVKMLTYDGQVRISGVKAGEKIICSGAHNISDGQEIEILSDASQTNIGGML